MRKKALRSTEPVGGNMKDQVKAREGKGKRFNVNRTYINTNSSLYDVVWAGTHKYRLFSAI